MRKIFIIGNGFDLNLGYPTRFKDFVSFCSNWKSFYDKENNDKYVNSLNESNINDMKLTFDKKTHKQVNHWDKMFNLKLYCDDTAKKELEVLNFIINSSGMIKYLIENINYIKYERWSDFENYLLELCEMCEEYEKQVVNRYNTGKNYIYNKEFYKFLKFVYVKNSVFSQSIPNLFNVESEVRTDKLKFIKELSEQLHSFTKAFNIYLKLFVYTMEMPQWSAVGNDENTYVLDFNYTHFCSKIFNKSKINYIHGYQYDDNIIIGINDEELSPDYDCLKKKFLRLSMNAKIRQTNQGNLTGQYEEISEYLLQSDKDGLFILKYVFIIGQSMNKVDWDTLIDFFNNEEIYANISICYHNRFDSQLLNLYQMLESNGIKYDTIKNRINSGYYSFHKFNDLESLFDEISSDLNSFVTHKHHDLNSREENLLKEIIKNQDGLIKGNRYLVSNKYEISSSLKSLRGKGYIEMEEAPRRIGESSKYIIKRVLKY